jgi:hypothetical protein
MRARLLSLIASALLAACSGAPAPETLDATETPTEVEPVEMAPPPLSTMVQLDLEQLQGTWKTVGALKAIKQITGNRETVTYLNGRNRVVAQHTADFELLRGLDDTVRVIAWSNLRMIQGAAPPESSGAYVYNCDGNQLVEFRGALGALSPKGFTDAVVWKRTREAVPATTSVTRAPVSTGSKLDQPVKR